MAFGKWLKDTFLGTPGGYEQVQNYNPNQQAAFNQLLQSGMQNQQNPYEGFEPLAQQTMNQFNQEIVPGLAERFTSMGGRGTGALSSPAFAGQLGQAGSGLAALINAQRVQYGQQNKQFGLDQARTGLTQQFENVYNEGQQGLLGQIAPALAQGAMMYATGGLSGASGVADLIGKGVSAFKGRGGPEAAAKRQWQGMTPQEQKQRLTNLRVGQQSQRIQPQLQQSAIRGQQINQQYPGLGSLEGTSIGPRVYDWQRPGLFGQFA